MRVLCLVDGRVRPPDRWIWNYLPAHAQLDTVDFMHTRIWDLFPKWGKLLTYYPAYWNLAMRALRQSRKVDYDVILAWESKNGFPLAVLRSLLGVRNPKLVILAFTYKGIAMHFRKLGRLAIRGIDHVTVGTISEIEYYHTLLGLPRDRITCSPLGLYDRASRLDTSAGETNHYIFAGGRTQRDYQTLFEAITGLDVQLIVSTRPFAVQGLNPPPNVKINYAIGYSALMAGSQFAVLPLEDMADCNGLTHLLELMSYGKAVVATRTGTTVEYSEDGQTGILVAPYDVHEMRSAIAYLLAHPEEAKAMGQKARQRYEEKYTFTAFAERTYDVLQQVASSR